MNRTALVVGAHGVIGGNLVDHLSRHLIVRLIWTDPPDQNATLTRSTWRRRHQHRARQCHYRARGHQL